MTSVVLLHAEHELGQRLGHTIAMAPGLELRGVADGLPALRELLAEGLPDVLVIDLMLRASHVRALLAELRGRGQLGRPLILALAMAADDPTLVDALCHGADGYYAHARATQSLPEAIQQLARGVSSMSPYIARALKAQLDTQGWQHLVFGGDASNPWRLSEADHCVLQWTAEGYLVDEVARGLALTPQAVGVRMRHIYRKMQFDRRIGVELAPA